MDIQAKGQPDQDADKKDTVLHRADDKEANLEDQMEDDYDTSRIQYGADGAISVGEAITQQIPINDMLDSEIKHTDVPTTKTVKPVAEWSVDEVQAWMSEESRKAIFERYLQVFKDNEVAGVNLLGLDDTKLKNMEVKVLSHRDAIMKQVDSLKSASNAGGGV